LSLLALLSQLRTWFFLFSKATKKALLRPVPDQQRMNEGLNKESADGADAELDALAAAVLTAIIEVHAECAVGGALR
jgi:hypothetical protein